MSSIASFEGAVQYALSCVNSSLTLKDKQLEVLQYLYKGNDVFAWFPTGYGKSICFQLLPFLMDCRFDLTEAPIVKRSVVLVISPLVSLMIDQVSSLQRRGVAAAILSGNKGVDSSLVVIDRELTKGKYRLLYTAPEAVVSEHHWTKLLMTLPLCTTLVAIAVDEAHCVYKWSSDFRPSYGRLSELRAFAPAGVPMLAATATVTDSMRQAIVQSLDMNGCRVVSVCPNKPNMYYSARKRSGDIGEDLSDVIADLCSKNIKTKRVIIYCQSLDMCANLYIHFHTTLGDLSYYPPGVPHISDNRLFGMYHSRTDEHNKEVIMKSFSDPAGTVRVVFATMALGMGVNFSSLTSTIHYGAPKSLEDYFQESGRAGRGGEQSTSLIFWVPSDAPVRKDQRKSRNAEAAIVRRYLENTTDCRRRLLLEYFDPALSRQLDQHSTPWCDNCQGTRHDTIIQSIFFSAEIDNGYSDNDIQ